MLANFEITGTKKLPTIIFDAEKNEFKISGRSLCENSKEFYKPVIDWLEDYVKDPNQETILKVQLEYFNTAASKCLLDVFKTLYKIDESKQVAIYWYYEKGDEDVFGAGEDFQSVVKVPFEIKEL